MLEWVRGIEHALFAERVRVADRALRRLQLERLADALVWHEQLRAALA